jgi:hypothetical protein
MKSVRIGRFFTPVSGTSALTGVGVGTGPVGEPATAA